MHLSSPVSSQKSVGFVITKIKLGITSTCTDQETLYVNASQGILPLQQYSFGGVVGGKDSFLRKYSNNIYFIQAFQ
jgi:hypothetical protein